MSEAEIHGRENSCYRVFMAVRRIQKLFFQSDNIMNSKEEMQKVVEYIKKIFIDILPYDLEQIVISNRDIDSLEYDIVKDELREFKIIVEPFTYTKDYNISIGASCK